MGKSIAMGAAPTHEARKAKETEIAERDMIRYNLAVPVLTPPVASVRHVFNAATDSTEFLYNWLRAIDMRSVPEENNVRHFLKILQIGSTSERGVNLFFPEAKVCYAGSGFFVKLERKKYPQLLAQGRVIYQYLKSKAHAWHSSNTISGGVAIPTDTKKAEFAHASLVEIDENEPDYFMIMTVAHKDYVRRVDSATGAIANYAIEPITIQLIYLSELYSFNSLSFGTQQWLEPKVL